MRHVSLPVLATGMLLLAGAVRAEKPAGSPLRLSRVIPLPGVEGRIDHLAVDLAGRRLFVAALGHNTVEVLDLKAGKHLRSIAGLAQPQGVAYLAQAGPLVVANGGDGSCRVFDGKTLEQLQRIDCRQDADNVRYDAAAERIYVGYGKGALGVIDLQRGKRVADIPLAGHPESFQLEAKGDRIFVNVPSARQIAVVDRKKGAVVATWPLKNVANFPMALDEADRRLLVGCRNPPQVLVIDTKTGKTTAALECSGDTDDLFYDAKLQWVYLSGGNGSISVFQKQAADRYTLLAKIPTATGARTCLFVPDLGCLYLAVPHRGQQQAEVREYRAAAGP